MLQQVRGMEPVIYDGEQTPERCIMSQLHPMAQMCYTAVPTSPDGNCLWHMVSLELCGTEELMPDLRVLTLVTLLENEWYFRHLLSSEDYHDESCFVGSLGWKISPSCTLLRWRDQFAYTLHSAQEMESITMQVTEVLGLPPCSWSRQSTHGSTSYMQARTRALRNVSTCDGLLHRSPRTLHCHLTE